MFELRDDPGFKYYVNFKKKKILFFQRTFIKHFIIIIVIGAFQN